MSGSGATPEGPLERLERVIFGPATPGTASLDLLSAQLEALRAQLRNTQEARDRFSDAENTFIRLQTELNGIFADLREAAIAPPAAAGPAVAAAIAAAPAVSRTDEERVEPARHRFSAMLEEVGSAMIQTQQMLDDKSLEYARQSGSRVGVPSSFRLPKLSASFRFAVESVSTNEFNLLFYSRGQEARDAMQQNIEVEIVAVPPTPEFLAAIRTRWPRLRLLTEPAERQPFLDRLEGELRAVEPQRTAIFNRTLLLQMLPAGEADEAAETVAAVLIRREPGQPSGTLPRIGAWLLSRASATAIPSMPDKLLENVIRQPGQSVEKLRSAIAQFADLAEAQAALYESGTA